MAPPSRTSGAIYQVPSGQEAPLATYHGPPATHGTFRAAFRDELGRGAARGLVQLVPGLIAAGLAVYGYKRLKEAYYAWRDRRQAKSAKATNAQGKNDRDRVIDVKFSDEDKKAADKSEPEIEWPPKTKEEWPSPSVGYLPMSLARLPIEPIAQAQPVQRRRRRKKG